MEMEGLRHLTVAKKHCPYRSDMLLEILVFCVTFCLALYFYHKYKYRNFPPGPWGIPVFGYLPFLGPKPYATYNDLAKKYGNIYSVNLGLLPMVVLNNFELIQKALRSEVFSGRPESVLLVRIKRDGIVYNEGRAWYEQRRFALRALKDLGFGKTSLEDIMNEELTNLVHYFSAHQNESITLKPTFEISLINTLWSIVAGERHSLDNPEIRRMHKLCYDGFIAVSGFVYFMPWLAKIAPKATGLTNLVNGMNEMKSIFYQTIKKRRSESTGELNDFIDYYLKEIDQTTDPGSSFYKDEGTKNLANVMINLFTAGSDTSSSLLSFAVLYLLKFPDVMVRVREEIERVLQGRVPTSADLDNMPYMEATMAETMRYSSIVSGSLLHSTMENVVLEGYTLPKGTIIMANLINSHFDPSVWGEDAQDFRPERFLLDGKFRKNDKLIPFSTGKRICPAVNLATSNFFIFLTGILQKFDIKLDPTQAKPSLVPRPGLVLSPQPYNVIFKRL